MSSVVASGFASGEPRPGRTAVLATVSIVGSASAYSSLLLGLLGALAMTAEFTNGTVTTSVIAARSRTRFLTAKCTAVAMTAAAIALLSSVAAFVATLGTRQSLDLDAGLAAPVLGVMLSTVLILTVMAVFGVLLGTVLRSGPPTIIGVLAVGFAIPLALSATPIGRLMLPNAVALAAGGLSGTAGAAEIMTGVVVSVGWLLVGAVAALVSLWSRDVGR